jgi:hypothetical protein
VPPALGPEVGIGALLPVPVEEPVPLSIPVLLDVPALFVSSEPWLMTRGKPNFSQPSPHPAKKTGIATTRISEIRFVGMSLLLKIFL